MIDEASAKKLDPVQWAPPPSIIWGLAIALFGLIIYFSRNFVLLVFLSATLAYLLNPLVRVAESVAIKRKVAVNLIYLGIAAGIVAAGYFLLPRLSAEINNLSGSLPFVGDRLDEAFEALENEIVALYPATEPLFDTREMRHSKLDAFIEQQAGNLPVLVSHLASLVLAGVLIPFFSYFFLRDSRKIIQLVLDRLPASHIETSVAIWCEIDRIVGRYLRGVAVEGMVIGVLAAVGLWMLGINYPLLLGLLSGIANVVPYLGPILGGGAAVLVALVQFKSLVPVAEVVVLYVGIKLLDVLVVQPLVVGREINLHPVLLIASVIVGGHVLGVIGMVVAVPTVTILQEIVRLTLDRRHYFKPTVHIPLDKEARGQTYVC